MYEGYSLFFTFFGVIISVINLIFYYRNKKRTVGDSIKHELINMPPYESEDDFSTIKVKNIGNTKAKIRRTCVTFDWDDDLVMILDYECEEDTPFTLPLNGEETFRKTLPLPPTKGEHFIEVCTCTEDSNEAYSNKFRTLF